MKKLEYFPFTNINSFYLRLFIKVFLSYSNNDKKNNIKLPMNYNRIKTYL